MMNLFCMIERNIEMKKTNYVKKIIDDYCVLDTETTGLSSFYDEIIEIAILKVRGGKIVDTYSQLIKPSRNINSFITELTGISNEMVAGMPGIKCVEKDILKFIGDDILLGHNTSFDINFINKAFNDSLKNHYMDTMQFCRKLYPSLKHHRLSDMAEILHLTNNEHRALSDCITTQELYESLKDTMKKKNLQINDLWSVKKQCIKDIHSIMPNCENIDEDGFFYGKHVVFTGKLEKMVRKEAMQLVVNHGGVLDNSVTKTTNYLILGNTDYNASLRGEKSSKQKKAEKLKLEGQDIDIIDELTFYDLMESE